MAELKEIIAKKYLIKCGTILKQKHLVTDQEYQIVKSSSLNDLHEAESNPYRLQLICHGEKAQLEAYYDRLDAKYRRILSKIKRKPRVTPRVPAPRVPRPARPPSAESVDVATRETVPVQASTLEAIPEEDAIPDPVITLPEWELNPSTSSVSPSPPSPLPPWDPYQLVEKPFPPPVPSVSSLLLEGIGDDNFGSLEVDGAREFLEMATGIEQPPMSLSDPQTVQLILEQFSSFRSVSQPADNFQDINPEEWMSPVETGPLAENEVVPDAAIVDPPAVQQPAISLSPSSSTGADSATGRPPVPTRRRARRVNRVRLPLVSNRAFIPPPRRAFDIFDIIIHRGIDTASLLNRTPNVNVAVESVHEIPRAPLLTVDLSAIQRSNDSNVRGQLETQNAEVELHEGTQNPLMPNAERNEETQTAPPSELMPQLLIDNPEPLVPIVPISSQEVSDVPHTVDLPQVTMPTLPSLETPAIIVDDGAVPLPVENATGLSEATSPPSMDLMLFDIFIAVQGEMCRQSFTADEGGVTVHQLKRLLNLNSRIAFVKMIKNILLLKQAGLLDTHCDANLQLQSVVIRFPEEVI